MTNKTYRFQTCYLCNGGRFFDLSNGWHYPCPLCGMDGCILVKEGEPPEIPGRLLRTVLSEIKNRADD